MGFRAFPSEQIAVPLENVLSISILINMYCWNFNFSFNSEFLLAKSVLLVTWTSFSFWFSQTTPIRSWVICCFSRFLPILWNYKARLNFGQKSKHVYWSKVAKLDETFLLRNFSSGAILSFFFHIGVYVCVDSELVEDLEVVMVAHFRRDTRLG